MISLNSSVFRLFVVYEFFCSLGHKVGSHPKKTIAICWFFVFLSALGFLRFHQEKNPIKLWVPPNSQFVEDTDWLMQKFELGYRPQVVQIVADDVLLPGVISKVCVICVISRAFLFIASSF